MKKFLLIRDHCTSIENLFFLTCAVVDLAKVRMAKSARGGPFSYSTLDDMSLCSRTFFARKWTCALVSIILSVFLINSAVQAQTLKVKALEDFSSKNPKETFHVQTTKSEMIFNKFFVEQDTVISGSIVKIRDPKRGNRDSCLEFMPTTVTSNGKTTHINRAGLIVILKGYKPVDKKDIAIKTGTTVADFFLKGLIDVVEFAQGTVQNKYGGRIKSGFVNVYKNSFFTIVEVGDYLNISSGDILVFKITKQHSSNF